MKEEEVKALDLTSSKINLQSSFASHSWKFFRLVSNKEQV